MFVRRFGMDATNISTDLTGARGVAIRLVPLMRQRCHREKNREKCLPSWQWLMDLYIDLEQYIGIEGVSPRQFIPWRSSLYFLGQRNPELRRRWEKWFGLKDVRCYLRGPDGSKQRVFFQVFSYKRPIKRGLQLVSARIDEGILDAGSEQERVIEFRDPAGKLVHRVILPRRYWARVAQYRKRFPGLTPDHWRGGVEKDPHIWAYTREFARRYHMPEAGISSDMEGAMALAFRKDSTGTSYNSYDELPTTNRCVFHRMNLWDIYLPPEARVYFPDKRLERIDNFYVSSGICVPGILSARTKR
jgi:hypothetical protein